MRAACCAFAISPLCSWRLTLGFLCVVGRQLQKIVRPRRSGRRPIPATSPGRDRMPLGLGSGAVVRLVAHLDDTPPLD